MSWCCVRELPGFVWSAEWRDCWQCGGKTTWIDASFEAPLCPGRCSEKAWDEYAWAELWAQLREQGLVT